MTNIIILISIIILIVILNSNKNKAKLKLTLNQLHLITGILCLLFLWLMTVQFALIVKPILGINDYFTPINSIISTFGLAGLGYTLYLQVEQNQRVNESSALRDFETNFFKLFEIWVSKSESLTLKTVLDKEKNTFSEDKGKMVFSILFTRLENKLKEDNRDMNKLCFKEATEEYLEIYNEYKGELSTYYKLLYHLVRFVDNSTLSSTEKYKYTSIVRSYLSDYETALLCFNGITFGKEKFKSLIERYSLLHVMSDEIIIPESILFEYDQSARSHG